MTSTIGEPDFPYLGATVLPRTDKTTDKTTLVLERVGGPRTYLPPPITYRLAPST